MKTTQRKETTEMATYELRRGFTLRRMFDAPPDVVFQAWTDPRYLDWYFNPGMPVTEQTEMIFHVQLPDHLSEDAVRDWMECGMIDGWAMTIDRLVVRYAPTVEAVRVAAGGVRRGP